MIEVDAKGTIFRGHQRVNGLGIKLYKDGPKSGQRWLWRIGSDGKAHDEANVTRFWHYDSLADIVSIWVDGG